MLMVGRHVEFVEISFGKIDRAKVFSLMLFLARPSGNVHSEKEMRERRETKRNHRQM